MSCDVIPTDIDEPYCNYTFSDSATSEGTIGKDYTELSADTTIIKIFMVKIVSINYHMMR